MIDAGQAVDIGGISEKTLVKHLKKLFVSLKLKEKDDQVFLLPFNHPPTLEIIGSLIEDRVQPRGTQADDTATRNGVHPVGVDDESGQVLDNTPMPSTSTDIPPPRKR